MQFEPSLGVQQHFLRHRLIRIVEDAAPFLSICGLLIAIIGAVDAFLQAKSGTRGLGWPSLFWIFSILAVLCCSLFSMSINTRVSRGIFVSASLIFSLTSSFVHIFYYKYLGIFYIYAITYQSPIIFSVLLISISYLFLEFKFFVPSQVVACLALFLQCVTIIGIVYGIDGAYGAIDLLSLAAVMFCVLSLLSRCASHAPLSYFLSLDVHGKILRERFFTLAICAIILGWIGIHFHHNLRLMPLLVVTALAVALFTLIRAHRIDGADALILAPDDIKLASRMETALANNEFFLVFQPQVDLGTLKLNGVEALIRWRQPDGRTVCPSEFIRVAELSELIVPMGALVLHEACKEAARWQGPLLKDIKISVNVSPLQLKAENFAETVRHALSASDLAPGRLIIELTESALVGRGEANIALLNEFRAMGVRVAIDDFGTGYSCLAYLRDLPNDYIKIDRSFVQDVPGDVRAESVARAIVGIGRTLGFRIVAEGIETWEQADFLKGIWCEEGQGYLFGRPMNAHELPGWANNWSYSVSRIEPASRHEGQRNV